MADTSDQSGRRPVQTPSERRDLGMLVALTLALHLPFITQAFHIDDVIFLTIARNVFQKPLFPLDMPFIFEGRHVTLWGFTHPPLAGYLIACVLLLAGAPSEITLHGVYLVFPLLATISFYFLAKRFVQRPLLATAIFATVPTLAVMAHTLMTDVPLLALWVCATTLFIYGIDRSSRRLETLAVLPLAGAILLAYQGLALIPLLGLYAFQRGQLKKREAVLLSLPAVLLIAWQAAGYFYRGSAYAATMFTYLGDRGLWLGAVKFKNAASALGYLGGTMVWFPFLFIAFGRRWKGLFFFLGLAAGTAGVLADRRLSTNYGPAQKVFLGLCLAGGFIATLEIILCSLERMTGKKHDSETLFLSLWFLGVLFYCVAIFISGSARYLLPAAPPLVLLLVRASDARLSESRMGRAFYATLLPCQLLLGLGLAHADYEFAGIYRQFAGDFERRYLSVSDPFLFRGEWGFRYYLAKIGGLPMADDSVGWAGELVVKSSLTSSQPFYTELDRSLELVERKTYRPASPLRLLDSRAKAGFWSNVWGVLPFWFSTQPLDEITVYRVRSSYRPAGAQAAPVAFSAGDADQH